MSINWQEVIQGAIALSIVAVLSGIGALAFRDWQAFRRLFLRLMVVVGIIIFVTLMVFGTLRTASETTVRDELRAAYDQDALPDELREAYENYRKELNRKDVDWTLMLIGGFTLYIVALYLFARPSSDPKEKTAKALKIRREKVQAFQERIDSEREKIRELEGELDSDRKSG